MEIHRHIVWIAMVLSEYSFLGSCSDVYMCVGVRVGGGGGAAARLGTQKCDSAEVCGRVARHRSGTSQRLAIRGTEFGIFSRH